MAQSVVKGDVESVLGGPGLGKGGSERLGSYRDTGLYFEEFPGKRMIFPIET